jgi:phage shock protein E
MVDISVPIATLDVLPKRGARLDSWIWLSVAVAVFVSLSACRTSDASAVDYKQLIDQGATLVDVRSDDEFARGSIPGALHVPHDQVEARLDAFGAKDEPVVVFCRSGARSGRVKKLLESKGWTQVHNAGGLSDLQ